VNPATFDESLGPSVRDRSWDRIGFSACSPPEAWARSTCVHAVLGDVDKAMAWLERAADTGFPCSPFFKIDPNLQNERHEPAFGRLVADLEATCTAIRIQRV
jgi:hypothetical protein